MNTPPKIPDWFRTFVGVAELLAAAGLILPGVTGIMPWLTPLAAAGLVITLIGAVASHASRRETSSAIVTGVLLLPAASVVILRWQIPPL